MVCCITCGSYDKMLARALTVARGPVRALGLWEPTAAGALSAVSSAPWLGVLSSSGSRHMAAAASAAPKKAAAPSKPSSAPAAAAADEADEEVLKKKKKIAVTVASKEDAPEGAAWRRNPADRASGEWMKDETAAEAYANLVSLANYRLPPRASALERVCLRTSSAEDLALVMKGLNLCVTRGTVLTERVAGYFAQACCRAGDPEAALAKFRDPARSRLFLGPGALQTLVRHAEEKRDAALLRKILGLVRAKGLASLLGTFDSAWGVAVAQARVGDVAAAVRGYAVIMTTFAKKAAKHKALHGALLQALIDAPLPDAAAGASADAAAAPAEAAEAAPAADKAADAEGKKAPPAGPAPLGDAEFAIVAQTLLPTARLLVGPAFTELVAKVRCSVTVQGTGLPLTHSSLCRRSATCSGQRASWTLRVCHQSLPVYIAVFLHCCLSTLLYFC